MHARTCVYSCASLGVLCGSTASSTCELEYTQPYGLTQMPIKLCADKHSGTHSGYRTQQPHAHLCVHTGKSPRAAQQIAPFPVLGAPPEQSLALVALCWSRIEGMGTGGGHTAKGVYRANVPLVLSVHRWATEVWRKTVGGHTSCRLSWRSPRAPVSSNVTLSCEGSYSVWTLVKVGVPRGNKTLESGTGADSRIG